MNETQQRFFEYLAGIQETCVETCMLQHKCSDGHVRSRKLLTGSGKISHDEAIKKL